MKSLTVILFYIIFFKQYLSLDPITVHIIPHTHDDTGWTNTYQEYFEGNGTFRISVKEILDNMVYSLNEKLDRTFIYVEIAFFEKWYNNLTKIKKDQVKELVKEGRLEFVNGGYVMNDEAASYYQDIVDQMRLGLLFLKNEFNVVPDIGWYIDPFGHSAANAHLLSKMGFDKIVLSRIDYKEKEIRKKNQTLEFIWKPFNQIDNVTTELFTHIQYDSYCLPQQFSHLVDDKEIDLNEKELTELSAQFYETMKNISKSYNHNQVLFTYGCDFSFRKKSINFRNIEKIMNYFETSRKYKDMRLIYSTPSTYFKVIKSIQSNWPIYKNQDFFPYAENPFSYWTGYYSSRPYLKGLVRDAGNYLRSTSNFILESLLIDKVLNLTIFKKNLDDIQLLRKNLAICQHHDAVAGTAKEYVSSNYINMLSTSIEKVRLTLNKILKTVIKFPIDEIINCINPISFKKCQNVVFELNERLNVFLIFANNRIGIFPVSFNSHISNLKIFNESMSIIDADIICNDKLNNTNCSVYFEQEFNAKYLFNIIIVEKIKSVKEIQPIKIHNELIDLTENNDFSVSFKQGNLTIYLPEFNQVYNISLTHSTYIGKASNQKSFIRPQDSNPDGAYVFAPLKSYPDKDSLDSSKIIFWNGTTVKQISLRFNNSTMLLRFYRSLDYTIEVESIFDPNLSQVESKLGINKVLHLQSNIDNSIVIRNVSIIDQSNKKGNSTNDYVSIAKPEFWTDSNGMKMMRRYKDFRGGWEYYITDPVSSNFYPVNHAISIREKTNFDYYENDYDALRDDDSMITIFTERSQSGGVMKNGEIMLLMNRFSKEDDWKGLEEGLYEKISLETNFRMVNWVSFSSNFNKKKIDDYIHKRPTIFSFSLSPRFHKNFLLKEFISEKFSLESKINDIISYDPCLVVTYHIMSENLVFVQAYNNNDPYFNKNKETCRINFKKSLKFSYSFDEISFSGTKKLNFNKEIRRMKKNIGKGKSQLNGEFLLGSQDLKLFSLKLN